MTPARTDTVSRVLRTVSEALAGIHAAALATMGLSALGVLKVPFTTVAAVVAITAVAIIAVAYLFNLAEEVGVLPASLRPLASEVAADAKQVAGDAPAGAAKEIAAVEQATEAVVAAVRPDHVPSPGAPPVPPVAK